MNPPSIKDIAQALGISIGTVDRALHGRSGVNPATRARVLKKAEQLGYRPNIAARALKLNRRLRIGVYFPRDIASFFDPLPPVFAPPHPLRQASMWNLSSAHFSGSTKAMWNF
jgi:DNA-binding LacI/PurR family transcriptional regulator